MNKLKEYLSSPRAAKLSSSPEYLPFFALPYISNPKDHLSYQEIFSVSSNNLILEIKIFFNPLFSKSKFSSTTCNSPCYATEDQCQQCELYYYYYITESALLPAAYKLCMMTFEMLPWRSSSSSSSFILKTLLSSTLFQGQAFAPG